MNAGSRGDRRASYLIAGAVLLLVVLVGAAYVAITAVRGNETDGDDLGPDAPASQVVAGAPVHLPAGAGR